MRGEIDPQLPFIQIHRSVAPKAAQLSADVGITYQHARGALDVFWEGLADRRLLEKHGRALGERIVFVMGRVELERRLKLAFGAPVGVDSLVALGFFEELGSDEFRVRGMSRYLHAEAGRKSKSRPKSHTAATPTQPGSHPTKHPGTTPVAPGSHPEGHPGVTPEREEERGKRLEEKNVRTVTVVAAKLDQLIDAHVAATPPKRPRPCAIIDKTGEAAEPEPVPVVAGPVVYVPPTSDPSTWLAADFWAWAQAQRQGAGLLGERTQPRGLSAWWATARLTTSAQALCDAFVRFCADPDPYWAKAAPQWPFAGFLKQWDRWVPATPVSRTPPRVDADVFAELRSRARELGAGGHVAEQLEQLRWERKGTGYVGVTEDGYHAQFLVEKFGPLLADLGATIDAPAVGGAA